MNLLFKSLGDPTRRDIIELLRKRDMNAGEIADHFSISKPSISHHLDLLRQANVVISIKVFDEMVKWVIDLSDKKKQTKKNK